MAAFGGYVSGFVVLSDLDLQIINTAKNFLDPSIQTRLFGLFTKLDVNGSGTLDAGDFTHSTPTIHQVLQVIWYRISHEFDADGNREITIEEFADGFIKEAYCSQPPKLKGKFQSFQEEFRLLFTELQRSILYQIEELEQNISNAENMVAHAQQHCVQYATTGTPCYDPRCSCSIFFNTASYMGDAQPQIIVQPSTPAMFTPTSPVSPISPILGFGQPAIASPRQCRYCLQYNGLHSIDCQNAAF